ncbi:MAG TPA: type IX secretion system outer membrane channel protein PorV [Bacteroidota bacterium]|nr:type IX secretion system outer membrane channel protein PorV [Bacteroidota bacterium]
MKHNVVLMMLIGALGVFDTVLAQGVISTAVPFLEIAPNSRASAMGEGGGALGDDAWAIYWNPAGYAFQKGSEISLSHANWLPGLGLNDMWIAHMAYKQPVEELGGMVGAQLTYLNYGEMSRTSANDPTVIGTFTSYEAALALCYSTKISDPLGIGVTARIIHSHLSPFGAEEEQGNGITTGFSFDVGLIYRPEVCEIPFTGIDLGKNLSLGATISNVGPALTYIDKAQASPLPQNLRLSVAVNLLESEYNKITLIGDANRLLVKILDTLGNSDPFYKAMFTTWSGGSFSDQLRQFNCSIGAEYWYGSPKLFALRWGYFYEDPQMGGREFMTFGAGISYDLYKFDFSYISASQQDSPLGETLRFTLSIGWGGEGQ